MVARFVKYNRVILKINLFLLGPGESPHNPKCDDTNKHSQYSAGEIIHEGLFLIQFYRRFMSVRKRQYFNEKCFRGED